MGQNRPDGPTAPTPEQLAAYLDGELGPDAHRTIEEWLAAHPEQFTEIEAQRALQRLWLDTAPPQPGEDAWAGVFAQVAEGVSQPVSRPKLARSVRVAGLVWLTVALGAAAVLLLAISPRPTPQTEKAPVAVLPVANDDDVQIISMDAADASALVVGAPPHRGPIVMASVGDVVVHASGTDVAVVIPDHMNEESLPWPLVIVKGEPDQEQ